MSRMFAMFDRFLGRGQAAVTVPPLDGGLKPNNRLDDLANGIAADRPDDIVLWQGRPIWSDGAFLCDANGPLMVTFASDITALATDGNRMAVATLQGGIQVFDAALADVTPGFSQTISHVTAMAFAAEGALWFCTGSAQHGPDNWRRDLMEKNRTGSVGLADLSSGEVRILRQDLGYPAGIVVQPDGSVVVSEAWASQLVGIGADGRTAVLLDQIPGYPGRLIARHGGGYWLCIFAPRSPLIEFVLREDAYRTAMLRDLDPAHWVAPKYQSGVSFQEPMQGGALKQMGILKPWAPTLSYGLVAELADNFIPRNSYHSRAGGKRHGLTAALEHDGQLWLAGRGCGEILTIDLTETGETA
tara:strand:+ start:155 stop:1228 length:1074 start_codon:yes stop_codon:yes gene_type:complete